MAAAGTLDWHVGLATWLAWRLAADGVRLGMAAILTSISRAVYFGPAHRCGWVRYHVVRHHHRVLRRAWRCW